MIATNSAPPRIASASSLSSQQSLHWFGILVIQKNSAALWSCAIGLVRFVRIGGSVGPPVNPATENLVNALFAYAKSPTNFFISQLVAELNNDAVARARFSGCPTSALAQRKAKSFCPSRQRRRRYAVSLSNQVNSFLTKLIFLHRVQDRGLYPCRHSSGFF